MKEQTHLSKTKFLLAALCTVTAFAQPFTCMADTTGDAKKGEAVFKKMQCAICHPAGNNILNPQKPLKGEAFKKKYINDKAIMQIVRSGIPGRGMPAFGTDKLSDADLVHLIAYVRSFSQTQTKSTAGQAQAVTSPAKNGR